MTKPQKDQLEALLDSAQLDELLMSLSEICGEIIAVTSPMQSADS